MAEAAQQQPQMAADQAPPTRKLLLTVPGERLLIPTNYNNSDVLMYGSAYHTFGTSGDLKKEVEAGIMEWCTVKEVYALLKNSDSFWVDIKDTSRFHSGCAVIKTSFFGEDTCHPSGYDGDEEERAKERYMKNLKCEVNPGASNTPRLKRYDIYGSVWTRRRYVLDGDDTFCFIQWMDSKALKLKERPVSTNLSDISVHVKSLVESNEAIHKEISEMKKLMENCTTLSNASLVLAESLRLLVTEQSAAQTALSDQVAKLCRELRKET